MTCCGPKLPSSVRVFVPGDLVVDLRGGKHIQIPVAVQIGGIDRHGHVRAGVEITAAGQTSHAPSVFSYQAILSSANRSREHIQVAVTVQSAAIDAACSFDVASIVLGAPNVACPSVFSYQVIFLLPRMKASGGR